MEETTRTSSRRGLLGRGLLVAAGAVGLGGARSAATDRGRPGSTTTALTLYGRQFHLHSPTRLAGEVPLKGDRHTAYAELLDRPGGRTVGRFSAAHLSLDSPFAGASSLEIHTFDLTDGTIHGLGSAPRGVDGTFVVLGGTGRYAGAAGSYVARQRARELGGDGTAEFELSLTGLEGANAL
jgi:hypothetical protein